MAGSSTSSSALPIKQAPQHSVLKRPAANNEGGFAQFVRQDNTASTRKKTTPLLVHEEDPLDPVPKRARIHRGADSQTNLHMYRIAFNLIGQDASFLSGLAANKEH